MEKNPPPITQNITPLTLRNLPVITSPTGRRAICDTRTGEPTLSTEVSTPDSLTVLSKYWSARPFLYNAAVFEQWFKKGRVEGREGDEGRRRR
jgi:hypothetical protein